MNRIEFKRLRLELGLTEKQLAKELRISGNGEKLIKRIEKGEHPVTERMKLHFDLYARIRLGRMTN